MSAMTEPWEINRFVREVSCHSARWIRVKYRTYRKIIVSVELNAFQCNRSIGDGKDRCACGI